jgi:hypothetical protein
MTLIRLDEPNAAIRRRPSGHTILIGATALLAGLTGLAGCSSSPPSSSPSSSPSCTTSGFLHRSGNSPAGQRPALVAALVPMPVIPDPKIDIDEPRPAEQPDQSEQEQEQEQDHWADGLINKAEASPLSLPSNSLPETAENLQEESDAVAYREDETLLMDDVNSDPVTFGEDVCMKIHALSENVENLDNLGQVILYLQPPLTSVTPAAKALAGVIRDANNQVALVFGACDQNLEVTKWLLKALESLFCTNVPSG